MPSMKIIRTVMIAVVLLMNIGCDQISKAIVRENVSYCDQIQLIKNCVTLTKVENTGAFLSLGHQMAAPLRLIFLSLLPVCVLIYGLYYLFSRSSASVAMSIGLCFIIGGGIGNIFDRLRYGSVTDFLHIDFGLFETGIFNMADVSVMVGGAIMLWFGYRTRQPNEVAEEKR